MKVTVDGVQIAVSEQGNGPPVLLLHGFPLSAGMWRETQSRLADGWRLIAPDLRGHGHSDVASDASMERLAKDQIALLDALEISEPVVLVALSMGGYVALEMARRWPERLRALVLVDTRAGADSPDAAAARRDTAERVLAEGSHFLATDMAGKLFATGAPAELVRSWTETMRRTPPAGIAAALRGMADRRDSLPVLEDWDRPLLVVVGEEDTITPPELAREMHRAVPGSRLEVIPGAGHLPPVEQPDHFARVLRSFLQSLPDGS